MPILPTKWVALGGAALVGVVYFFSITPSRPVVVVDLPRGPDKIAAREAVVLGRFANCPLSEEIRRFWLSAMRDRDEAERPSVDANLFRVAEALCTTGKPSPPQPADPQRQAR